MIRYLYGFAALVALIVAAALVAPGFLDWSRHKPDIAVLLQRATGHPVLIAGDVSVALVPTPSLEVRDVRMPAAPGTEGPDLARIKSVRFDLALLPLFGGTIETRSISVIEPDLVFMMLPDGRLNWSAPPGRGPAQTPAQGQAAGDSAGRATGPRVRLDQIAIKSGRVTVQRAGGTPHILESIDATIKAETLAGPFRGRGTALAGAVPIQLDFRLGRNQQDRLHLNGFGTVPSLGIKAELKGDIAGEERSTFSGRLRLEGAKAGPLVEALGSGPHRTLLDAAFDGRFTLEGEFLAAADSVGLSEFQLDSENNRATGSLVYRFRTGDRPDEISAGLILQRIDLDRWRSARRASQPDQPASPPEQTPADITDGSTALAFALPTDIEGALDVALQAVVLNRSVIRDLKADLRLVDGEIVVNEASARLPGGTQVTLIGFVDHLGGAPRFDGSAEVSSDNLRGLLDWLSVDVSRIPTDRLRRWSIAGKLYAEPDIIRLSQFTTDLDLISLSGWLEITPGPRPVLSLSVDGDRLDLDAYMPRPAAAPVRQGQRASDGEAGQGPAERPALFLSRLADFRAFDVDLKARLGSLVYLGQEIRDVVLDAGLDKGAVVIRGLRADDVAGSDVRITGRLGDIDASRALGARLEADVAQPAGLLALLGVTLPREPRTDGPLSLSGKLSRAAGGQQWTLQAKLTLGAVSTTLAGTAAYRPGDKDAVFTAEMTADEVDLDLLSAALAGPTASRASPRREASARRPGGMPTDATAWSESQFNLAVLRLPPSAITLRADRMIYLQQHLDKAELKLESQPGVLEVPSLTGQLHGGAFALSAKLSDAESRQIAVTMNATLDGADAASVLPIAELVALEGGKLGFKIALSGNGGSPRQLLADLSGKGRVWAEGGRVLGIDLARANRRIGARDKAGGLVGILAESASGATALTSLGGDFRLEKGMLRIKTLRAVVDGAIGEITGTHDLLRREVEAELRLRFAAAADAPPLLAKVKGPIGSARVNIDFKDLQDWLLKQPAAVRPSGG